MNLSNRQVWLFKEGRSGSEWIWLALEKRLERGCCSVDTHIFSGKEVSTYNHIFDSNIDKLSDPTYFYATHYFTLLSQMKKLENPYLIRTTRRNKTEQCMSSLYFKRFSHVYHHWYNDDNGNVAYNNFLKTLDKPVVVLKQEVMNEMKKIQNYDTLWNQYSKDYDNCVIVYEDLEQGITLPFLENSLKFSDELYVKKTPNYKETLFANYDEIVEWSKYYESMYGLTTY